MGVPMPERDEPQRIGARRFLAVGGASVRSVARSLDLPLGTLQGALSVRQMSRMKSTSRATTGCHAARCDCHAGLQQDLALRWLTTQDQSMRCTKQPDASREANA